MDPRSRFPSESYGSFRSFSPSASQAVAEARAYGPEERELEQLALPPVASSWVAWSWTQTRNKGQHATLL